MILEGNRKTPHEGIRPICAAIVDPVRDQSADSHVTTLDADELATIMRFRALGLVCGDRRGVDTVANLAKQVS